MKKLNSVFAVALMAVTLFSCSKKEDNVMAPTKFIEPIQGSFIAQDGDIILKATPIGVTRTWTMYATNSTFYNNVPFALVRGNEFITGSVAQVYWSKPENNPVTFGASQAVYSNLTPDEPLRIISESKDAEGKVAYLGILDFDPSVANFPLTVNCFRLGDVLTVNADALTNLPGGDKLAITVEYKLAPVDIAATKLGIVTGTGGVPNGKQFTWEDIIYKDAVDNSKLIGKGNFVVYEGLDAKVKGKIVIKIADNSGNDGNGPSTVITKEVDAAGAGIGLKLTLTTNKIGWYDSGIISFGDNDITVEAVNVPVN
jgi:hypothetical protein